MMADGDRIVTNQNNQSSTESGPDWFEAAYGTLGEGAQALGRNVQDNKEVYAAIAVGALVLGAVATRGLVARRAAAGMADDVIGQSARLGPAPAFELPTLSSKYFASQNLYDVNAVRGIVDSIKTLSTQTRADGFSRGLIARSTTSPEQMAQQLWLRRN